MTSLWDLATSLEAEEGQKKQSPDPNLTSSWSTSPTQASSLHQRKEEHAQRKRNRVVLSCIQCRRRKLKCDRQYPCSACTRRGAADECLYQKHEKGRIEDPGVLEKRMEALEKLVRKMVGETALQQIKAGSYDGSATLDPHEYSSGDETVPLGHVGTAGESSGSGPGTLENLNLAMGQLTILSESGGGTLYAGGTAWDAVFAQFAELKALLKQDKDVSGGIPEDPQSMAVPSSEPLVHTAWLPSESFHIRAEDEILGKGEVSTCFPFNNCVPPSMDQIIALLPSQTLMDRLLEKFFVSILPFNKIVHQPTFRKELKEFQQNPSEAKPGWVALLFCVLTSALMSFSPTVLAMMNDTTYTYEQLGKLLHRAAKAALVHAQFLRNHTLPVIQALMLLQLSVNPEEMSVSSWALHGATKNLALQMGLHREPSLFKIPEPEAEIRRRIWWCIYIQDRLSCVNHGIAVSFRDEDMDCREPLIVNDEQITPEIAETRHTFPSGTDAPFCEMTLFFCQLSLAKILTHIIQVAFGLRRINYSKILKLDEEIEVFRQKVRPRVLVPDSPGFDKVLEPISMITRCFSLKAILLLHRPFIGRSKENEQFKRSRDRAVQAALLIARNSIHLFTHSNVVLENHYAAYPMLAHGLFPAPVALALDLYTYPDQPNPEAARQALLDIRRAYLSLCSQFSAMKRIYKIINVLMGKAWEKQGLTLPKEDVSGIGPFNSISTPSPLVPNFEEAQKWGPQGVVPTSMQQFLPAGSFQSGYDYNTQQPSTAHLMSAGATNAATWDANFPLFGSDMNSASQSLFCATPQFSGSVDMENNVAYNQTEWDLFVSSMDLDPVVNGMSFL